MNVDLSNLEMAAEILCKYPKPDYLFASPPCESWVDVSKGNLKHFTTEKGFSLHWKEKWKPFDLTEKYRQTRQNGIKTALTTAHIIQLFKPRCWAIENGRSSLIFDYMNEFAGLKGNRNICNYYSYGFQTLKPTIIYSNAFLLLKCGIPKHLTPTTNDGDVGEMREKKRQYNLLFNTKKDYSIRSLVPPLLYEDIVRQFEYGGQKTLFPLF